MKIIFLDFDGVLNVNSDRPCYVPYLNPQKVQIIKRICDETDAKIVVSSYWRLFPQDMEIANILFKEIGLLEHIIDYTEDININEKTTFRKDEIKHYLNKHPNITNFVIIDDTATAWDLNDDKFFKINPNKGITNQTANKIIRFLTK